MKRKKKQTKEGFTREEIVYNQDKYERTTGKERRHTKREKKKTTEDDILLGVRLITEQRIASKNKVDTRSLAIP